MYKQSAFCEQRLERIHALIQAHPFGMLVWQGPGGLDAAHLPFELDPSRGPNGTLLAHVARGNALAAPSAADTPVMAVFRGPHAYVSPNWYPSKHDTHRQVPTWNYQVVHAHGRLRVLDDERFVRGVVARLTRMHEQRIGEPRPWRMGDAPAEFLDDMLTRIVGIEFEIDRLDASSKLSQNKAPADRQGVIDAMARLGRQDMVDAMNDNPPA